MRYCRRRASGATDYQSSRDCRRPRTAYGTVRLGPRPAASDAWLNPLRGVDAVSSLPPDRNGGAVPDSWSAEIYRQRAEAWRQKATLPSAKLASAQAELASASELRRELDAAQITRSEAEADASELRQADTERRARDLWSRLRAAWRGE